MDVAGENTTAKYDVWYRALKRDIHHNYM